MTTRSKLFALAILAIPGAAMADPVSGLYVGAAAGGNVPRTQSVQGIGGGFLGSLNTAFGPEALASVGYGFGNGVRIELQGDYRSDALRSVGPLTARGSERQLGGFVNALYDVNFDDRLFGLMPYVGVGVGYEQSTLANGHATGRLGADTVFLRSGSTDGSFAVQGIVGASYPIQGVNGLSLTADYRFTGLTDRRDVRAQAFAGMSEGPVFGRLGGTTEQSFTLGVRYNFGSPAAPSDLAVPPTVRPAAEARTYLVFFEWDHSDLSARAQQIVTEAATASRSSGVTRIEVDGHTDASGTHAYNQALSVRRANTVAAELVKDGVPISAISVHGYGETHQLAPTAPGQREPQNRRVEIILR